MHREDNSMYLLYIEPDPKTKAIEPVEDEITEVLERALELAISGTANYSTIEPHDEIVFFRKGNGYKGWHSVGDGEGNSSNKDYLLPGGYITNSLAPYYARYYRSAIPKQDLKKIEFLKLILSNQN